MPFVRRANRVTVRVLPPPVAGTLWQAAHERSLKTGPSPSVTCYHYPPIFICDVE